MKSCRQGSAPFEHEVKPAALPSLTLSAGAGHNHHASEQNRYYPDRLIRIHLLTNFGSATEHLQHGAPRSTCG